MANTSLYQSYDSSAVDTLAGKFVTIVVNPIIALLFVAAFLVFAYGIVEFLAGLNGIAAKKDTLERGQQHMLWGVIGLAIMSSAWAIVKVFATVMGHTMHAI